MIASIPSATLLGVEGRPVTVEVHVSGGLPGFTIVGLPDQSCREARDRVRAALLSSGFGWPASRVTVNLAPTGLRKAGSGLDLAIAVATLVANDGLKAEKAAGLAFVGELGLDGTIRPVPGVLSLVDAIDAPAVVVPPASVPEALLVARHEVRAASTITELVAALTGDAPWPPLPEPRAAAVAAPPPDLSVVRGQPVARFALEVAAAGGHHLLMIGPPGAGKTLLATRLPGILPPLSGDRALEATRIHSAAGQALPAGVLIDRPPLRAPHHSASAVSIIGGGAGTMRPGEISLAHGGVLFLDEMGEFPAPVLDSLRQPLEEGVVRISRAELRVSLPARFLLVAAMNPCPCGGGDGPVGCRCGEATIARYVRRISGPVLDRFDLRLEVRRPDPAELIGRANGEPSAAVARRVAAAREAALARGAPTNAELSTEVLERVVVVGEGVRELLESALRAGTLSARGLGRVQRVALTIADLRGEAPTLTAEHVALALGLRAASVRANYRMAS